MRKHIESLIPLFITKLDEHSIIFSHLSMKKYRVLLNIVNNFIIFSPNIICTLEFFYALKFRKNRDNA